MGVHFLLIAHELIIMQWKPLLTEHPCKLVLSEITKQIFLYEYYSVPTAVAMYYQESAWEIIPVFSVSSLIFSLSVH